MAINQEILKQYNDISWEKLLREDLGDSGNLKEVKPNFDRIKNIFDRIINYSVLLDDVPNYKRIFENTLQNFINQCKNQLLGSAYTNTAEKTNKITAVRNLEESIISQLSPIFSYLQFADPKNEVQQKDLVKRLKEVNALTEKVEKALEVSGSIAQKQEVNLYGSEFENLAEGVRNTNKLTSSFFVREIFRRYIVVGNKQRASRSQWLMMFFLFATLIVALIFVFGKQLELIGEGINTFERLWKTILEQNILVKLFIISAGGYLVAHFSRNYSAEMNMYYINKHRQLALNSHQRILDAVTTTDSDNDSETKNAILLQVAKTMFDIQETGYLKNGNNPVPTTQVIETVRSGIPKSGNS